MSLTGFIKNNPLISVAVGLFVFNLLIWYAVFEETPDKLKVVFLNVGQGDAVFIETPEKNQILIDGGPDKSVLRELGKVMPSYDRKIDALIISHPDQDHIGGLPEVLKKYKVGLVIESGSASDSADYQAVENLIKEKGVKKYLAQKNFEINSDSGAILEILSPAVPAIGWDTNMGSVVARLSFGEGSFLFTGDAPKVIEDYLAGAYGAGLESDVLKVAHHGSRNSLSESFLSAVSPEYSVISVGSNNRFGHPHKEILDALGDIKSRIIQTSQNGAVIFETDGEELVVKE